MAAGRSSSSLAIFLLVFGKVCGIVGLVVASWNRTLGGILLVIDAVFIVAAIIIALRNSQKLVKEANADKEVVARLVREGALKQYLREIEDEKTKEAKDDEPAS